MRSRLAFLLAIAVLFFAAAELRAAEPFGQVEAQSGSVIAIRGDAPLALFIGAPLEVGDRIVTGRYARLRIGLPDGSTFSLGSDTDIVLTALGGERGGIISLFLGILRSSLVSELPGGFEVRTPSAVASVRSTDWIVEALADKSAVFVVEGRVAVSDEQGSGAVLLDPGLGTDVPAEGLPSEPKQWGKPRVEDVLARTSVP